MIGTTSSDSLADASEQELVRHLLHDWHWGSPVISRFEPTPGAKLIPEIPLAKLGKEGDIDLLCASSSEPQRSVAIQFKLAKVRECTYDTLQPNKLKELKKLYQQTNALVEVGFSRVFACLVILIDGRDAPKGKMLLGGLTDDLIAEIDQRITLEGLHPEAGLLRVDFVQDPVAAPLTDGEIGLRMLRFATSRVQSEKLNQWVLEHVSAA